MACILAIKSIIIIISPTTSAPHHMSWGVDNNTNRLLYKYLIQLEQMRAGRAIEYNLKTNLNQTTEISTFIVQIFYDISTLHTLIIYL